MREIKFRVWDKYYKEMHICGEDVHDNISFSEYNIAFYYNLQNGEGSLTENSSYVLMQYTGLKDKNGTEIYEGDILESVGDLWLVEWDEEDGMFTLLWENIRENFSKMDSIWFQIVGNIYDDPELLER